VPIETTRVEPGIYRLRWYGDLTVEDILGDNENNMGMFRPNGETNAVLMIDMKDAGKQPLELPEMGNVIKANQGRVQVILLHAPFGVKMIGSALKRLYPMSDIRYMENEADALEAARQMRDAHLPTQKPE
jgi:hypothetical protein